MKNKILNGLVAAPFTIMNKKGEIELNNLNLYVNRLVNNRVTGAFVCGTSGEGASLTTGERKAVLEEWILLSGGNLKIIAHVGGTCQPQSIELAGHASEKGAFAISAYAPYFYKPSSPEELLQFLKPIAAAAPDLPFYYYHIPSITGVNIPVANILLLCKDFIPNFTGIKFTHFDMIDMQESIALSNGDFEIMNGFDEILICGLSLGLKSAVGSTFNYMSSLYMDMIEAFNNNNLVKARELQQFSVRVINILNKYGGALRAGKAIMSITGTECGQCRAPLASMDNNEKTRLKNELANIGFFETIKIL